VVANGSKNANSQYAFLKAAWTHRLVYQPFTGGLLCMQENACVQIKALGRDVGRDLMAANMAVMLAQKRQACLRAQIVL